MLNHLLTGEWHITHGLIWLALTVAAFFVYWFFRQLHEEGALEALKDWLVTPEPSSKHRKEEK